MENAWVFKGEIIQYTLTCIKGGGGGGNISTSIPQVFFRARINLWSNGA